MPKLMDMGSGPNLLESWGPSGMDLSSHQHYFWQLQISSDTALDSRSMALDPILLFVVNGGF